MVALSWWGCHNNGRIGQMGEGDDLTAYADEFIRVGRRALLVVVALVLVGLGWAEPLTAQQETLDEAAARAMSRYNAESGSTFDYVEVGRTVDATRGGVIYMRQFDKATGVEIPGIVEWLIVLPDGGGWRTLFPGDAGYTAAFDLLPNSLMDRANDRAYRETGDPAITAALTLNDYELPWENAAWATVTRSYDVHGQGKIDFDLTGSQITAAKDGVIVYASDRYNLSSYGQGAWWYWNTVIIQHGPNEMSLYGHLAQGSIPDRIKSACSTDSSGPNCAVPVSAGEVIGAEGATGYSINPHLHIELGQGFGVASYPDALDWDGDGDRREPVYGGYVYAEHNVAFRGYTPEAVAGWAWGRVEQAAHGAQAAVGVDVVRNGGFDAGTLDWIPTGQLNWSVVDGVMRIARLRTSDPPNWAGIQQSFGVGARANTPFEVSLRLGNSSGIPKYVQVSLHNGAGRPYGEVACEFIIPAGAALQPYSLRGANAETWASVRLEIDVNPPDSAPAALVDDVQVRRLAAFTGEPECAGPDGAAATG